MAGPLSGFRIVDISERSVAAAVAGMLFADLGAEVIRVEPPGGDPIRALNGTDVWFRGQKSVTVGPEQVKDGSWLALRRSADVVITTEQPWSAKPSGLLDDFGEDPRQILTVLTAFPRLPDEVPGHSLQPVYGELAEAVYGWPFFQDSQREGPIHPAWPHASFGTAWLLQIATLAALFDRERSGQGQTVTLSLVDGMAILGTLRWVDGSEKVLSGLRVRSFIGSKWGSNRKGIVYMFECSDGGYVSVHTGARGAFQRMMIAMDRLDLVVDETSSLDLPQDVATEMWEYLTRTFKTQPVDHWVKMLSDADVCCMPVLQPGEALWLEQIEANGMVDVAPDGTRQLGKVGKFSRTPMVVGRGVPKPGEHSADILGNAKPLQWKPTKPVRPVSTDRIGPLDGVTVLDFGFFLAGPFSPRVLADLGARVIKVEEVNGDPLRRGTANFLPPHRGKEDIAIDMKSETGRAVAYELVKRADVVHHNLRVGSLPRLGLEYETLRAINPGLVYMHSTGYGNDGPWSSYPTLEPLHSAVTGLLTRTAGPGNPPEYYLTHMDYGCALTSTLCVIAALIERERSGLGQYVEVPQTVAGLYAMSDVHGTRDRLLQCFAVDHEQRGHAPSNAMYQTRDGWMLISCYCDEEWQGVKRALALPAAVWPSYGAVRNESLDKSHAGRLIERAMASLDSAEAMRRLLTEGVPHAPLVPVSIQQATGDPSLRERHVVIPERHPEMGDIVEVGHTMRFSLAKRINAKPAPALGEDTVRILEELGKSTAEIAELLASGGIHAAPTESRVSIR
jgi:crotonobetainyl-CoA:carnitine CoA-transferase CaiB-like acyl-CoA transferase